MSDEGCASRREARAKLVLAAFPRSRSHVACLEVGRCGCVLVYRIVSKTQAPAQHTRRPQRQGQQHPAIASQKVPGANTSARTRCVQRAHERAHPLDQPPTPSPPASPAEAPSWPALAAALAAARGVQGFVFRLRCAEAARTQPTEPRPTIEEDLPEENGSHTSSDLVDSTGLPLIDLNTVDCHHHQHQIHLPTLPAQCLYS